MNKNHTAMMKIKGEVSYKVLQLFKVNKVLAGYTLKSNYEWKASLMT